MYLDLMNYLYLDFMKLIVFEKQINILKLFQIYLMFFNNLIMSIFRFKLIKFKIQFLTHTSYISSA